MIDFQKVCTEGVLASGFNCTVKAIGWYEKFDIVFKKRILFSYHAIATTVRGVIQKSRNRHCLIENGEIYQNSFLQDQPYYSLGGGLFSASNLESALKVGATAYAVTHPKKALKMKLKHDVMNYGLKKVFK